MYLAHPSGLKAHTVATQAHSKPRLRLPWCVQAGANLFRDGDRCAGLFEILSGTVRLSRLTRDWATFHLPKVRFWPRGPSHRGLRRHQRCQGDPPSARRVAWYRRRSGPATGLAEWRPAADCGHAGSLHDAGPPSGPRPGGRVPVAAGRSAGGAIGAVFGVRFADVARRYRRLSWSDQ